MSKHIDNLKEVIIGETRKQLIENGFIPVTMRSVALSVGISAGTLYNYFESKDALIAEVILEDWLCKRRETEELAAKADTFKDGIIILFRGLQQFAESYAKVFGGPVLTETEKYSFSACHRILKQQIGECLRCAADNLYRTELSDAQIGIISAVIIACVRDRENLSDYLPDLMKVIG